MKPFLSIAVTCFASAALGADSGVPEIPFESAANLLKLSPGLYIGEASGVAINSKKHMREFQDLRGGGSAGRPRGESRGPSGHGVRAQEGSLGWMHELACPSGNEIYAGEILNWRVQKLALHPAK